jgi:hypothetical protein
LNVLPVRTVGENPPGQLSSWQHKGIATRACFQINYGPGDGGKPASIVARWFNHKGEFGPPSNPITAPVVGGIVAAA